MSLVPPPPKGGRQVAKVARGTAILPSSRSRLGISRHHTT